MKFSAVVKAAQMSGAVIGMQTRSGSPRMRWWALVLDCGHETERGVRYQKGAQRRGWGCIWQPPPISLLRPAPKKVKCERCEWERKKKGGLRG